MLSTRFMMVEPPFGLSPWCPIWDSIHNHLLLPVTHHPLPSVVSDLWIPNACTWNLHLLSNILDPHAIQVISQVKPVHSQQDDVLRWTPAKKGDCTTKNIYIFLSSQNQVQLPSTGSRSITNRPTEFSRERGGSKTFLLSSRL
jgi:hypothetical protein